MSNLIDNAMKYSKESIEIKISSHYDDRYTIIKIYDNGIGISKKDQRTILTSLNALRQLNVPNMVDLPDLDWV